MSDKLLKAIYGTRDILPDEAPVWSHILSTVARLAADYNYGFIQTPVFEATELFARGIGETTDIVSKEMYTFKDHGNRSLTLRPEGTASVIRAYLEHSMAASQGLVKVWYLGPMFRQERPQAGRLRQFYQFGLEAIGSLDPAIDAEVIGLNYRILSELGLENLQVHINSIGMPEDRQAHRQAFAAFITPQLGALCQDCQRRFHINPLRMFDCKEEECKRILSDAPVISAYLSLENKDHFQKVTGYLEQTGVPCRIDTRLVRGLDYYTRTAWEIKSDKLGSQDSLSGGGRYDLLAQQLGGAPTPGIGFAAGIERIIMAMPPGGQNDHFRKGVFIVIMSADFKPEAVRLVNKVRSLGFASDIDYLGKSMKAQMKQAGKSRFNYAFLLAQDELARGVIIARNMISSEQKELRLDALYGVTTEEELGELLGK